MFGLVPFVTKNSSVSESSLFDHLLDVFDEPFKSLNTQGFKVDVKDNGSAYELKADLPGFNKDNVALSYENNYLTISAKREDSHDEKDNQGNFIRRERSSGQMSRSFYISGIDEHNATAEFKDGVLRVQLPKLQEQAAPDHQIPISCAG